jgi:uncharacterized protein
MRQILCSLASTRFQPITAVLLASALLVLAVSSISAQETTPKGITVSGQGEVFAAPDIARISVGVTTEDKDAARAAAANAKLAQKTVESLLGAGIAKKDVQTSQFSVQPVLDYKVSPPRVTGYQVSNVVRATVRDLSRVGDAIDRSIAAGANNVQGISFEIENDSALRDQALKQAVKAASDKAKVLADALGVNLVSVIAASESVGRPIYPMMMARSEIAGAPQTPVLPGQVSVTASVTVVYNIMGR